MVRRLIVGVQEAWDRYLAPFYYPFVCVVFGLVVTFNWWYGQKLADDWEQWTIADWLISYAPGFVRRGLSGEALIYVSDAAAWPANQVVLWTFVLLFALFVFLLLWILRRRQLNYWYFALCLSPGSVLFTFYNPSAVGRKEILIFVLFAIWVAMSAGVRRGYVFNFVFGVAAAMATLMHEAFFFFTPYFVIAAYVAAKGAVDGSEWRKSLLIPACSAASLVCLLQFSGSLNDSRLCSRLLELGAPAKVCEGVLEYRSAPPGEALERFIGDFDGNVLQTIGLVSLVVLIPLFLFLHAGGAQGFSTLHLMALGLLALVFSFPLFVLAVDWGRWTSIHLVLLTVTCAVLLPPSGSAPAPARASFKPLALAAGALVLASMLTWSLNYCCGGRILTPFGPVDALTGAWEDFEL